MRLCLFSVLLFTGLSWAAQLSAPAVLEAEVGGFLSIAMQAEGGDRLEVLLPDFLQLVGEPRLQEGRALVNVLVSGTARAGEGVITLILYSGSEQVAQTQVRAVIAVRAGLELRAPDGETVIDGEEVHYRLLVTNTGNSRDRVRLEVRSTLQSRLTPDVLELDPGATGEVTLILQAQGRRLDVASVAVSSGINPELILYSTIRTTIQPFAGAAALDGPALAYSLSAETVYGTAGLGYGGTAGLSGALSEFVNLNSNLTLANNRVSGTLGLRGGGWGVSYRGLSSLQRLDGNYGPFQAFFALPLDSAGFSTGVGYAGDPFSISLTHVNAERNTDTLRIGYGFNAGPNVRLTPQIGLVGSGVYGQDYRVQALTGFNAQVQTEAITGNASFQVAFPYAATNPWTLNIGVGNRVQRPVGLRGDLGFSPRGIDVGVSAQEVITDEVTLTQRLDLALLFADSNTYGLGFGVNYRPLALPLQLSGGVLSQYQAGEFALGFDVGSSYRIDRWTLSADFGWLNNLRYGAGVNYGGENLTWGLLYRQRQDSRALLTQIGGRYQGFQGALAGGYDFAAGEFVLDTSLAYQIAPNYDIFGSAGYGEAGFRIRIGGRARVRGGFATPDGIVELFGGRIVGYIEGRVTLPNDGQASRDGFVMSNLEVRAGDAAARVNTDGSFRLRVRPGDYAVTLGNLPADLALSEPVTVSIEQNDLIQVNLGLRTVVGFTGVVLSDPERSGSPASDAAPLAYVRVLLNSSAGNQQTARSDDQGRFFFQGLNPGTYTVMLDESTLPDFFDMTTAPLELTLQPGPFPRVTLGAAARPREVTQTFATGDLTMIARTEPPTAPPGADVRIIAEVQGTPEAISARLNSQEVMLTPIGNNRYEGYLTIPTETVGVANLEVIALGGAREIRQSLIVIVMPGPLATVQVSPAFVAPGEVIQVSANFLTQVEDAYLVLGDARFPLVQDGLYRFSAELPAPDVPDSHELQLWVADEQFATANFRVSDPN
jgi:hypothetical protein